MIKHRYRLADRLDRNLRFRSVRAGCDRAGAPRSIARTSYPSNKNAWASSDTRNRTVNKLKLSAFVRFLAFCWISHQISESLEISQY
jgi:hypothetical protein